MERLSPLPWQEPLWRQLLGLRERLPHALLLHGMRGIGKRHFARALAQALLCEAPAVDGRACGQCVGCRLFGADNHPDLRWLVPAADRPPRDDRRQSPTRRPPSSARRTAKSRAILIDQVREIAEFLTLASHRGGRRIVLLYPAEALNGPAANALLKLLEEPPPAALFIAVTDDLDALLPTVRSRCVLLRAPVPDATAALAWLRASGVEDAEERLAEAGGAPVGLETESGSDGELAADLKQRLLEALGKGGATATGRRRLSRPGAGRARRRRDPSVSALGMGLIGRKDREPASLLSPAETHAYCRGARMRSRTPA